MLLEGDPETFSNASQYSANQAQEDELMRKRKHRNRQRSLVFLLLFLALFAARTDQGVIPAIATTLKKEFNMNSVSIGSLGSMVYLGAVVGSLIAIPLLDFLPTKLALMSCLF